MNQFIAEGQILAEMLNNVEYNGGDYRNFKHIHKQETNQQQTLSLRHVGLLNNLELQIYECFYVIVN